MNGEKLTRAQMEERRLIAVELLKAGYIPADVARRLQVSRTSAVRWRQDLDKGKDPHARRAPGRPSRLTGDQLAILQSEFKSGVRSIDLQAFIECTFGVKYDLDHTCRLRNKLGIPIPHSKNSKKKSSALSDIVKQEAAG